MISKCNLCFYYYILCFRDDGHYSVVVAVDASFVYLMDPSTLGHYTFIARDEFDARWHDVDGVTPVWHLGIVTTSDDTTRVYSANKLSYEA